MALGLQRLECLDRLLVHGPAQRELRIDLTAYGLVLAPEPASIGEVGSKSRAAAADEGAHDNIGSLKKLLAYFRQKVSHRTTYATTAAVRPPAGLGSSHQFLLQRTLLTR